MPPRDLIRVSLQQPINLPTYDQLRLILPACLIAASSALSVNGIAQVITEYTVPTNSSLSFAVTPGSDGALWFTEVHGNKIGRITTAGVITEYRIPTSDSKPIWIVAGTDGALWFTEMAGNNIGRITTLGAFTEYALSTAGSDPWDIISGPDGALWFTEHGPNFRIGRITTDGAMVEYPVRLSP